MLFIIESAGKLKTLNRLLIQLDSYDHAIVATHGRLFDFPQSTLGIDLERLTITEQQSLSPKIHQAIIESAKAHASITLLTDNDPEGELIAEQVYRLLPKNKNVYRAYCGAFTVRLLKKALAERNTYDPNLAKPCQARHTLDRLIGFRPKQKGNRKMRIGRVLSPMLQYFRSRPTLMIGQVRQAVLIDHEEQPLLIQRKLQNIPHTAINLEAATQLTERPEFGEPTIQRVPEQRGLLDGAEALIDCCQWLNQSPATIQQSLQRNYAKGRISYPRSDSKFLSADYAEEMNALAAHFGVNQFDSELIDHHTDDANKSHTAVIPLDWSLAHCWQQLDTLSLDDAVLAIITRHTILAGHWGELMQEHFPLLAQSHSQAWFDVFAETQTPLKASRQFIQLGTLRQYEFANEPVSRLQEKTHASIESWLPQIVILKALQKQRLGKPSTLHIHCENLKHFIDPQYHLNATGYQALGAAQSLSETLISHQAMRRVEQALLAPFAAHESVDDRLQQVIADYRLNGLKGDVISPSATQLDAHA